MDLNRDSFKRETLFLSSVLCGIVLSSGVYPSWYEYMCIVVMCVREYVKVGEDMSKHFDVGVNYMSMDGPLSHCVSNSKLT